MPEICYCGNCKGQVSCNAGKCPHCGVWLIRKPPEPTYTPDPKMVEASEKLDNIILILSIVIALLLTILFHVTTGPYQPADTSLFILLLVDAIFLFIATIIIFPILNFITSILLVLKYDRGFNVKLLLIPLVVVLLIIGGYMLMNSDIDLNIYENKINVTDSGISLVHAEDEFNGYRYWINFNMESSIEGTLNVTFYDTSGNDIGGYSTGVKRGVTSEREFITCDKLYDVGRVNFKLISYDSDNPIVYETNITNFNNSNYNEIVRTLDERNGVLYGVNETEIK